MRRVASFVLVVAGAALAACATQAPPPPAPAATASAALPAGTPTVALVKPSATTLAAAAKPIPYGYTKVVLDNGDVRFCRNDVDTGSRVSRKKVCLTQAQLEASEQNSQDFINSVQHNGSAQIATGTPGAGGAMGH